MGLHCCVVLQHAAAILALILLLPFQLPCCHQARVEDRVTLNFRFSVYVPGAYPGIVSCVYLGDLCCNIPVSACDIAAIYLHADEVYRRNIDIDTL